MGERARASKISFASSNISKLKELVLPCISMSSHVVVHIALDRELLVAFLTFERLDSRVGPFMSAEVTILGEKFAAVWVVTLKVFCSIRVVLSIAMHVKSGFP